MVLKPANRLPDSKKTLPQIDRVKETKLMVRCGLPGEQVFADVSQVSGPVSSFFLLHVQRKVDDGARNKGQ